MGGVFSRSREWSPQQLEVSVVSPVCHPYVRHFISLSEARPRVVVTPLTVKHQSCSPTTRVDSRECVTEGVCVGGGKVRLGLDASRHSVPTYSYDPSAI